MSAGTQLMVYKGDPAGGADWAEVLLTSATAGTVASIAVAAVLSLRARTEGKGALQPINATSHIVNGPESGRMRDADLAHTAVGAAAHHAAAMFWSLPFGWWLASRKNPTLNQIAAGAGVTAGVAAAVDYGLLPKQATPGWEHAVSPKSIVMAFVTMAVGLTAGGLAARALRG